MQVRKLDQALCKQAASVWLDAEFDAFVEGKEYSQVIFKRNKPNVVTGTGPTYRLVKVPPSSLVPPPVH